MGTHPQIAKIVVGHTGVRCPGPVAQIKIHVSSIFRIGGSKSIEGASGKSQAIRIGKARVLGEKVHYPAYGIASVGNGTGPKNYLGIFYGKGIYGNDVLYIASPKNGVVHTDPVHGKQYPIGRESTYHGTAASQLTFLDKDLTTVLQ